MMKKITLLLVALVVSVTMTAQIMLTQSVDPANVTAGGVACWNSGDGSYSANSFYRVYNLVDFGVTGDFDITSVEFGQGSASEGKLLALRIYTADTDDLSVAVLTFIAEVAHTAMAANDLNVVSENLSATIPAGSTVVFEVFADDSLGAPDQTYFPGNNDAGENDDSYLMSDDCGISTPTPITDVVGPESYVMNVVGDNAGSIAENVIDGFSMYPNPVVSTLNLTASNKIDAVSVYNMLGQEVVNTTESQINVSNFPAGSYIVKVQAGSQIGSYNFIKE